MFGLRASLMVVTPSEESLRFSIIRLLPIYLPALASSMKVIVISPPHAHHARRPFETFRHNLLLHIVLQTGDVRDSTVNINTLRWHADHTRKFVCIESFDQLVFRRVDAPMTACASSGVECSMESFIFQKRYLPAIPHVRLRGFAKCNGSQIGIAIMLTVKCEVPFDQVMLNRFSLTARSRSECFSLIRWRETDILSMIKPLESDVLIMLLLSIWTFAKVISWSGRTSFVGTAVKIALNFISAVDLGKRGQRCSEIIAAGSASVMCFLFVQIYLNFMFSTFLNRNEFSPCRESYSCRHVVPCYSSHQIHYDLLRGYCPCDLNSAQQNLVRAPLHRTADLSKNSLRQDLLFMQIVYSAKVLEDKGQHLINPIRVSSTINRMLETGVVSEKHFEPVRTDVKKYLNGVPNKFMKKAAGNSLRQLKGYLGFGAGADSFDMESFHKIRPLFAVCIAVVILVFCSEIVAIRIRKICPYLTVLAMFLVRLSLELIRLSWRFIRDHWIYRFPGTRKRDVHLLPRRPSKSF